MSSGPITSYRAAVCSLILRQMLWTLTLLGRVPIDRNVHLRVP